MNQETLSQLSAKDLQHYRQTLLKRIQDLKTFNIELGKQNVQLAARLNQVRIQAHKNNISLKNFDFDDLYKMGKEKVVKITSSGKNKIKSGISYAGSVIKKYIKKDDEYNINENADFNSYDLSPKKDFSSPQNQGYNPKIGEEIDGKNTEQKERKKIFEKSKMVKEENDDEVEDKKQDNHNKSENSDKDEEYEIVPQKIEKSDEKKDHEKKQIKQQIKKVEQQNRITEEKRKSDSEGEKDEKEGENKKQQIKQEVKQSSDEGKVEEKDPENSKK